MTGGHVESLKDIYLRAWLCEGVKVRRPLPHMSIPANTRSFRIRLALQTIFVAGALVAAFGAAAWWYASESLERSVDARISAQAQRVWNRIDPRTSVEEFQSISDTVFGPVTTEAPMVMVVKEHVEGTTIFKTQGAPNDLDAYFRSSFPTQEELRNAPPPPNPDDGRPRRKVDDVGEFLGLPRFDPPPQRGDHFRPQMPMVRDPVTFSARSGGVDWRWGVFSSPQYSMFVGLSLRQLHAEVDQMAWWYTGAGVVGLALAGLAALWTSKRAMRPLDRVVATAQRLTASDLAERIPLNRDDDREFAQLIGVLNGMTERLEGSFQQAIRFTADASHELKTPLAVMLATLDDAVRHTPPGSAEHERFASLFEEAARLKTITQSLLLLSQADAGRLPTHPETYNLSMDLSRLIEDGEIMCEAADLKLQTEIEPEVTLHADRALLRQVFQNLLSNAIKYNRPQGSVRITLRRVEAAAVFQITNTGPAIPSENHHRLFERFFRGDKAHNRQTDGFGLGLNIAHELARANGADLRLVSSQEDETVFEVKIDLAAEN